MAEQFNEREKGFEAKYKLDEEQRFKAEARRNKLLGMWAADRMGMSSDEREAYAQQVVLSDLEEPGIEDVVRKVMADFAEGGVDVSEDEVRDELERLLAVAIAEVSEEFPEALGDDH